MLKWFSTWRVVLVLALLAAIAWFVLAGLPDGKLHVWFLDVGQGDAILIRAPDGRQILVDGGPSPSALLDELGEVLPFWDRSLDLVVLTHGDADHVSGLVSALERYKVTTVLDGAPSGDRESAVWLTAVQEAGIPRVTATRGTRLAAGAMVLTVLNPGAEASRNYGSSNDASVVLRVDYGETSMLLTGDAEEAAEQAMMEAGLPLAADVLKVGHHGSAASTSPAFLAQVAPQVAVISAGAENRFGHPSPEVLARLAGVQVLRTDQRGRVEVISDGQKLSVRWER